MLSKDMKKAVSFLKEAACSRLTQPDTISTTLSRLTVYNTYMKTMINRKCAYYGFTMIRQTKRGLHL